MTTNDDEPDITERTTFVELVNEKKAEFNGRFERPYVNARRAVENGRLRVVEERVLDPYRGHGFELGRGQLVRYELVDGPQIIDTAYLVKWRPSEEWACIYATAQYGALTPRVGMHYFSNTPYMRPLLTLVTDTIDYANLKRRHGGLAEHNFVYPAGRCHAAMHEQAFGEPNLNNCDFNLLEGIARVAGDEIALQTKIPNAFMHFQPVAYDQNPMNYSFFSSKDVFRRGDHVELLAHDDLFVAVSLCPSGDQHDMTSRETLTTFPVRLKILEGAEGPLETATDPGFRSMTHEEFVRGGFRSTASGHVGTRDSPTAFPD